jgi:tight adherence protein B
MSAYVLGGIPFFIIGGLLIMAPAYLAPLLTDPRGRVLVAVATGSLLTGFIIIGRMMRSVTGDA